MNRQVTPLRIALLIGMFLSAMRIDGCLYLDLTDVRMMDYRLIQRGPIEPGPEVLIVAVDGDSLATVGRWPWPRTIVAKLLRHVLAGEPAAVGLDLVFSEASSFHLPDELSARPQRIQPATWDVVQTALDAQDEELIEVISENDRIVLGSFFDFAPTDEPETPADISTYTFVKPSVQGRGESRVRSAPALQTNLEAFGRVASAVGYFNVFPDGDGFVRRLPLTIRYGEINAVPLSLATLRTAVGKPVLSLRYREFGVESVRLGDVELPVEEDGQMLINYRGPGNTFPHVSALDILTGMVDPEVFADRIVLIGVTATAVADVRVTPFDEVFPGVEIHANAIDNILRGDFVSRPRWVVLADIATVLALALILGIALRRVRGVWGLALASTLLAGYLAGSQWLFVTQGLPLSFVYPMLAIALIYIGIVVEHYVTEEREKRKVRKALDLYLSPSMAELVSRHPERLALGGEKRELTVFFSDIRGFTSISEKLTPEELVELLNEYLGDMTDIIFEHDGMLDKYIGDAVMAVWGAPLPQEDHARRACVATLEMTSRLAELNEKWAERGWPELRIGCGLNSGPMVFGNMGSSQHLALTVMGDNVNLGSRLEGLNKTYGTSILISESTRAALNGDFVTRELDMVRVKGRMEPVRIYELVAEADPDGRWSERIERFHRGLADYRAQNWDGAEASFVAILAESPEDGPARLYRDRCRAFRASPPPSDWDGVTTMETK